MAIKVVLSNPSQITSRTPDTQIMGTTKMSRATYQYLGSLIQNKGLIERDINGNIVGGTYTDMDLPLEYIRVLDELNDLFLKTNYPLFYGDLVIAEGTIELDEYLGSLGITEDYPYSKDAVNIPVWLSATESSPERQLVDYSDDSYLVDTSDNTRLVRYV